MEEDRELIAASREGDHEAFRTIVERHKEGVLGVAMSRVRDFDDAQDVAQVTFVEAYHRLGSLKDGAKLGFWLRSIAHNRAVDAVRSRRRAAEVAAAAEPPGAVPTPHEELEQIEIRDHVWAALERLKKPQREAVILHYLSGYTQEEVATMLDVPVGTVKYRLHEARTAWQGGLSAGDDAPSLAHAPRRGPLPARRLVSTSAASGAAPRRGARSGQAGACGCQSTGSHEAAIVLISGFGLERERWEREAIPLVLPLLFDRSKKVRHYVAGFLNWRAPQAVPLETAVQAVARELEVSNLPRMQRLLCGVLAARQEGG